MSGTVPNVDGNAGDIAVEVAFASPSGQWLMALRMPAGSTVLQVIDRSGIRAHLDGLAVSDRNVGVFAQPCRLDTVVVAGDRVEIYRPLIADPKMARRERAVVQKRSK